ncbi:MAG: DNA photolyase [Deferribacteraceae bacterium]|nr:DNA photolyase [Deferribacteraceae bacterium]
MIHVEKAALDSPIVNKLERENIAYAVVERVEDVPDRKSEIVVLQRHENYCRPCPGTKIYRCCGYYTTDVMEGCPFDCSYCILQAYLSHKNIRVSGDTVSITNSLKEIVKQGIPRRLGTGELSDSLALDGIFPFTLLLAPVINNQDVIQFEFKTKSANIRNLLGLNPKNIVVSWSLNPQNIITDEEYATASLEDRLNAAKTCAEAGFKLAFHFDPVICCNGYAEDYSALILRLINVIPEYAVEYVSISAFRAPSLLIDRMRERKERSAILKGDLSLGLDGKFRYFKPLRRDILNDMLRLLNKHWTGVFVYYCMEHASVWEKNMGNDPGEKDEFEKLFPWSKKHNAGREDAYVVY